MTAGSRPIIDYQNHEETESTNPEWTTTELLDANYSAPFVRYICPRARPAYRSARGYRHPPQTHRCRGRHLGPGHREDSVTERSISLRAAGHRNGRLPRLELCVSCVLCVST